MRHIDSRRGSRENESIPERSRSAQRVRCCIHPGVPGAALTVWTSAGDLRSANVADRRSRRRKESEGLVERQEAGCQLPPRCVRLIRYSFV